MNLEKGHRYNIFGTRYGGKPFSYEDVRYDGEDFGPATGDKKLRFTPRSGALAIFVPVSYLDDIEELS